jgi:hypothetical protein
MNLKSFHPGFALGVLLTLLTGCAKKESATAGNETTEPVSHVKTGTNGEVIVTFDAETQKRMGLQTTTLAAAELKAEAKAYGRVLDASGLSSTVADLVSARAAAEASRKELARLKTLAQQNNASARALENAEANAQRDAALVTAAWQRLLTTWGKAVAERVDLADFVQSLAIGESALVRVDLPAGEALESEPTGARLLTLAAGQNPIPAKFLGLPVAVDPQTQSRGFLFLVETNSAKLAPGAAVTAFLSVAGGPQNGVVVPRAAVIRHAGEAWIFLETNGTNFIRRAISLGPPLENGWFVPTGVKAGDQVVVTGAQAVFSEELNSSGFKSGARD